MTKTVTFGVLLALLFGTCTAGENTAPLQVAVSIPPQAEIVKQIGGGRVTVMVLLPAGQSPELFDPSPRLLAALSEAKAYFTIGFPFENNLVRRLSDGQSSLKIVNVDATLPRRAMQSHDHGTEGNDADGQEMLDPHVWLDPIRVKTHATVIGRTLCDLDPDHCTEYSDNLGRVLQKLDSLDHALHRELDSLPDRRVYVFHPAFGYFTDRYGLQQIAVETEGKEPSARQLAELLENTKNAGITALFVQPQFSKKTARAVADDLGCRVVTLDPLASDYFANLGEMARQIAAVLGGQPESH